MIRRTKDLCPEITKVIEIQPLIGTMRKNIMIDALHLHNQVLHRNQVFASISLMEPRCIPTTIRRINKSWIYTQDSTYYKWLKQPQLNVHLPQHHQFMSIVHHICRAIRLSIRRQHIVANAIWYQIVVVPALTRTPLAINAPRLIITKFF